MLLQLSDFRIRRPKIVCAIRFLELTHFQKSEAHKIGYDFRIRKKSKCFDIFRIRKSFTQSDFRTSVRDHYSKIRIRFLDLPKSEVGSDFGNTQIGQM